MIRFMLSTIVGLAVLFLVLFGILFHEKGLALVLAVSLGPLLPWPILLPVMAKTMKSRTVRALDSLLESMALVGKGAGRLVQLVVVQARAVDLAGGREAEEQQEQRADRQPGG